MWHGYVAQAVSSEFVNHDNMNVITSNTIMNAMDRKNSGYKYTDLKLLTADSMYVVGVLIPYICSSNRVLVIVADEDYAERYVDNAIGSNSVFVRYCNVDRDKSPMPSTYVAAGIVQSALNCISTNELIIARSAGNIYKLPDNFDVIITMGLDSRDDDAIVDHFGSACVFSLSTSE